MNAIFINNCLLVFLQVLLVSINSLCLAFSIKNNVVTSRSCQQNNFNGLTFQSTSPISRTRRLSPQYIADVGKETLRLYAVEMEGGEQDDVLGTSAVVETSNNNDDDDEEEEEWELVEYENLNESDFLGSEWKVGTAWNKIDAVDTTWVRLVIDEKTDNNLAIWGDGGRGTWKVDVAAQFFTVSQDTFGGWGGKKIWAGPIEDFYYLQGTVRGWNVISPASVIAQWQMIRLGVDREEAGAAPWFKEEDNSKENENEN